MPSRSCGTIRPPALVTAAGMPRSDAADLVRHMSGPFRLLDALRRADALVRTGPSPAALAPTPGS